MKVAGAAPFKMDVLQDAIFDFEMDLGRANVLGDVRVGGQMAKFLPVR